MAQMRAEKKNSKMEESFKLHLKRLRILRGLSGLPMHDRAGLSLCKEFANMKRELVNVWRPLCNSLLVCKTLPSGKALGELKMTFLKALYEKLQLGAVEEKERGHELAKKKHVGERIRFEFSDVDGEEDFSWGTVARASTEART